MVTAGAAGDATRLVRGLRWVSLGRSERAAWGRCQGSAATPYETVVAADRPSTTSCSCPSRHRPCKHAVGLADLAADGQIAVTDEPDWVARHRRSAPLHPADTGRRGVDRPERGSRSTRRRRPGGRRPGGTRSPPVWPSCQLWLGDQVRTGLAGLPRAGYGHFDAIAARMVDAQAPGVAATLRALPADLVTADWPERALHALGGLHLLARAHQRLDELPEELAATVRSRVGYPVSKETVRGRPAVLGSLVGDRGHRHRRVPAHHPAGLVARTRRGSLGDVADRRAAGPRPGPHHPAGSHVRLRGAVLSRLGAVPGPDRAPAAGSGPAAGVRR